MNFGSIKYPDVANGPGVRVSLFVSGCPFRCQGCFNQETQNSEFGSEFTMKEFDEIYDYSKQEHVEGVSILGGDPLFAPNREAVAQIVILLKNYWKRDGLKKTIRMWTGYEKTLLDILRQKDENLDKILKNIDVLVDGQFKENKKDLKLKYRGSSNQRVWDMLTGLEIEV